MVRIAINYIGEKHCELTHTPSGSKIATDAPKDNKGKGEAFSPTDLLAASMGSCMLTTMAIMGEKDNIVIDGSHATVDKEMAANPRRVSKLTIELHLPKRLTAEERLKMEDAAMGCPVHKSLHPEMQHPVTFHYDV